MLVGIIGAPNKGKSTLFSAITNAQVPIANYPFTTINPNKGVGYVTHECPEVRLNIKCNARNNLCIGGVRKIPFNIIDDAALDSASSIAAEHGNISTFGSSFFKFSKRSFAPGASILFAGMLCSIFG